MSLLGASCVTRSLLSSCTLRANAAPPKKRCEKSPQAVGFSSFISVGLQLLWPSQKLEIRQRAFNVPKEAPLWVQTPACAPRQGPHCHSCPCPKERSCFSALAAGLRWNICLGTAPFGSCMCSDGQAPQRTCTLPCRRPRHLPFQAGVCREDSVGPGAKPSLVLCVVENYQVV